MDMDDIMCITCGQAPVPGAARRIGEADDAGHTDTAHEPNWSQTSFAGSEWAAHPAGALWYGEIIGEDRDGQTDYVYGYADSPDAPDVALLLPGGWTLIESAVKPTPRNSAWTAASA